MRQQFVAGVVELGIEHRAERQRRNRVHPGHQREHAAVQGTRAVRHQGRHTLQVGVILPDTTSSTRYVDFDAPYLNAAFADAGYTQAQYRIDNAQGSDSTELDDATADINLGAKILVMDPIDNSIGATIAQLAASKNVTLIRMTAPSSWARTTT